MHCEFWRRGQGINEKLKEREFIYKSKLMKKSFQFMDFNIVTVHDLFIECGKVASFARIQ